MKFEHCNYLGELELKNKDTPGCRLYELPDGQWVPSITSVTSFYNRQIFIDWRKRVGLEEANRITKKATTRGTDFHEAAQAYLENRDFGVGGLPSCYSFYVSSCYPISGQDK